jgi:hypothetical protein
MLANGSMALQAAPGAGFRAPGSQPTRLRVEHGTARETDAALVRLSQLEARARRDLGRLASRFAAIRGHDALGFRSVGDYARELLGISGRELQSFAFVASRLERLPRVAAAFARGEISWSQARLLCAVASRDDEASWLDRARGLTVRELVLEIRRSCAVTAPDVAAVLDDESDETEGEPRVRLSVACPARVTLLWRRAVELARRMLGSQASISEAAEAIVAEVSSGEPIEVPEEPGTFRSVSRGASGESGAEPASMAGAGRCGERAPLVPEDGCALGDEEIASLDAFGLHVEMRRLVAVPHRIDTEMGTRLRRLVDLALHRDLGFASFDVYARERLGLSPAKARALVALERRAREHPELGRAYRSGELSWVRSLSILPVLGDPYTPDWVARAKAITVRRLQDEVEWVLDMRDAEGRPMRPPAMNVRLDRPDLQTCARPGDEIADRQVTFHGPASVVALFRAGVARHARPNERAWRGLERMLLHAIAEWESRPRHRDPIFARDGWRCSVPGCTARRNLEDHHVRFRSRGGGNEPENRTAVCTVHHAHGIHRGVIRASGRAPDDLVWELGRRPGRAPLLRFHGERYLSVFDN